jgi:hypothetical protein
MSAIFTIATVVAQHEERAITTQVALHGKRHLFIMLHNLWFYLDRFLFPAGKGKERKRNL